MVHAVCLQSYHCQQQRCRHYKCENMFVVCVLCFVSVLCCHSPFTFKIHIQSINPLQSGSNKRATAASVSVFIGLKYIFKIFCDYVYENQLKIWHDNRLTSTTNIIMTKYLHIWLDYDSRIAVFLKYQKETVYLTVIMAVIFRSK